MNALPCRVPAAVKAPSAVASVATSAPPGGDPPAPDAQADEHGADGAHDQADGGAGRELHQRPWPPGRLRGRPELAGGDRQRERHERSGETVVEPALHVEQAAYPDRDPRVVHHLGAQRGVGGRQGGAHEPRQGPGQVVQQPRRQQGAEEDREREPETQQSRRKPEVPAQCAYVDPRGVGEEQQRQRDLREQVDRGCLDVDRQRPPGGVAQEQTGHEEDERPVDLPLRQQEGDDRPPEHEQAEDREGALRHVSVMSPSSPHHAASPRTSRAPSRRSDGQTCPPCPGLASPGITRPG